MQSTRKKKVGGLSRKKTVVFDMDGTLTKSKTNLDTEMAGLLCALLRIKTVAVLGGSHYPQFQNQLLCHLGCARPELEKLLILPVNGGSLYQYRNGAWRNTYEHTLKNEEKDEIKKAMEIAFLKIRYTHPKKLYGEVIEDRKSQISFSALGQEAPLQKKKEWNARRDISKIQALK